MCTGQNPPMESVGVDFHFPEHPGCDGGLIFSETV